MAEGYVRLALPAEAADIAALQLEAWSDPAHPAHAVAAALDVDQVASVWERSIVRPPLASHRVLVSVVPAAPGSVGRVEQVVGFIAVAASDDADAADTDGAVVEHAVSPDASEGHLTRLVQAAVDTMRADGFTLARWWVPSTDDALRTELTASGWAPDGAHQELVLAEDESVRVKLVRLHTDIS